MSRFQAVLRVLLGEGLADFGSLLGGTAYSGAIGGYGLLGSQGVQLISWGTIIMIPGVSVLIRWNWNFSAEHHEKLVESIPA